MKQIKIGSILLVTALVIAFIFTIIAFTSAANSLVSVFTVLLYFILGALFFGVAAIIGLKQPGRWGRFAGVASTVAAIYMIIMGIVFMRMLNSLVIPSEYAQPGTRPDSYEAPPTVGVPEFER